MISMVVTCAANLRSGQLNDDSRKLTQIHDISDRLLDSSLSNYFGRDLLHWLLALGILGASLVGSIVVSLTAAWGLGEVTGYARSLETVPSEAPWFYIVYAGILSLGAGIALSPIPTVKLNIVIQTCNAA